MSQRCINLSVYYPGLLSFHYNPVCPENKFDVAVDYYTQAIEHNPYSAVLHSNRSLAYVRMKSYSNALSDADKALELDSKYIKVSSQCCCGYGKRGEGN